MADVQLTPQQAQAVTNRGGSLLVSAAAGSGKTKVLVERVFSYLTEEHCHIDDFLIITFTRAAAAELRSKLASELAKRVAQSPEDEHLRRQMFRVYQADIKTVDGFCASLLREHVHLLEPVEGHSLTPDFRILDESEASLLKEKALEQALESFYQRIEQGDEGCASLAATLGFGRDDRALAVLVPELHGKLQSHPYPAAWLEKAAESWKHLPPRLGDSVYGRAVMEDTVRRALYWAGRLERAAEQMDGCQPVYDAYADRFLDAAAQLRQYEAAAQEGWDAMGRVQVVFRRMGTVRGDEYAQEKNAARAVLEKCRKAVGKLSAPYETAEAELLGDMQAIAPAMEALLALTEDFDRRFRAEKVRRNAMDFSDQEHYAVQLLSRPDGTPTELGEQVSLRYREIMVDEYQDTNEVQNCIFRAVSRQGENIFAVGDVKQSIYRFRLAEPGIFLEKYRTYAPAEQAAPGQPRRMVLSRNFRSRREVLDATNFVFGAIMSREMGELDYTEEQQLHPGADYPEAEGRETEFHYLSVEDTPEQRFDRAAAEAQFVARRVRRLLEEKYPVRGADGSMRPVEPEDIVILMRSPASRMAVFSAALEREGIPCDGGESEDFFAAMEIAVVLSLLEVVDNPRQDVPLIAVLRSPLVGMSADRLAAIRAVQQEGDYYEALRLEPGEDAQAFLTLLDELRQAGREMSADKLLWYIYDRCHVMAIFGAMEDGAARQARLTALYDYVRRLVQSGRTGLFDCVSHLRQLLEKGDAPVVTAAKAAGGVRIMSVHKSKGLEFPVVILADLCRAFNRQDMDRPVLVHPQLGVGAERVEVERRLRYDTISKTALALVLEREAKAEELRILYVAMTRAQEKLIMVCSRKNPEKHLRELCALTELPVPPEAVSGADCPGDWLVLALMNTYQAADFHRFTGVRPPELREAPAGLTVRLHRIDGEEEEQQEVTAADSAAVETPDVLPDEAALAFAYGHGAATVTPTKVTATQLKGRAIDEEIAEGALPRRWESVPEKPRFLQEKQGLTGAERGTAMHLVMQFLPLDTPPEPAAVRALAETLTARRLLTPEQAAALDVPALARFLSSPLAARIRAAKQVWREYRFSLLTDAGLYDPAAAGEEMLLQGVADCVFETADGLTVVDFKTDRVTAEEAPRRAEVYRTQLNAYAGALAKILQKPVTERVLYFFACDREISL